MGDLLLHPTHWLFGLVPYPVCPECRQRILPLTPVAAEDLADDRQIFRHAECAGKQDEDERGAA